MKHTKKIFIILNTKTDLEPSQSTAMFAAAGNRLNIKTYICAFNAFIFEKNSISCFAKPVSGENSLSICTELKDPEINEIEIQIGKKDLVLLRVNPARVPLEINKKIKHCLDLLKNYENDYNIVNKPSKLLAYFNKNYLGLVPKKFIPETFFFGSISNADKITKELFKTHQKLVLKPMEGTHGNGVFLIDKHSKNLNALFNVTLKEGFGIIQTYIPEAKNGDIRIIIFRGEILKINSEIAAVKRVPGQRDFRSNIHAGATAQKAQLSQEQIFIAKKVSEWVYKEGIELAGLDLIGTKIVEINVFATGGFKDANKFSNADFDLYVIEKLSE